MADTKTSIIISAEDRTRQAFESATNGLRGLESAASRLPMLGAALATAFSGATFTAAISDAIKFTASLDDMAEKTGASVETLSGLARVAQIGGHDLGVVEQATIKLAKGLAEADNKSSGASRALKALGLSAEQLRGMDTGQALKVIADRLNEFKDGAGKSALAMDLLGKSGAQALPYLKDLAEQGALVATTTTEQAAAAEKYEKNINRLRLEMDELARTVANKLVPAFNDFLGMMNKGGFGGALSASLDRGLVGGDIGTRIKELQDELTTREKARTTPGTMTGGGLVGVLAGVSDEGLRRRIAALKELYAAEVLANNAASYSNEGRAAGMSSLAGYVSTDEKDPKKAKKEKENPYAGLAGFGDGRSAKEVMAELHAEDKALEALKQKYIAMADPLQQYRMQLDEINKLRADGTLTAEQATEAEWAVNDALDAAIDKMDGLKEKGTDTFKELSQAIDGWGKQSAAAIADFVIDGKGSFEDLGKAFAKELLQMAIYQSVMKPLATGTSTWLAGLFAGSGTASTPAYAQGTNYVPNDGLAYLHQGEAVIPAKYNGGGGMNVQIHNYSGAQVSTREVPDGRGGRKLEVQIGELVAAQMRTPGSAANRARNASTMVRR